MKRNKYFDREKDIRRLESQLDELYKIRRNTAYVELEKPIKMGKIIRPQIREDILRSDIGPLLQDYLDQIFIPYYMKRNVYKVWEKKNRPVRFKVGKRTINFEFHITWRYDYHNINPKILKHLERCTTSGRTFFNVPYFYITYKVENWIVTHQKVIDPDVESKISYIESRIAQLTKYKRWITPSNREYKRFHHKSNRVKTRKSIHDFIYGEEDEYYDKSSNKKDVLYYWW